ncbi:MULTISPECIES: hypothetical protein [unclassified Microcoleus]|uniref:hypothetical protein n=1 Tax=unclassified Microcoleus TaxID=2642155 RepID=UPI002FD0740E
MPVPQEENSSFVEGNRQDACSTRREFISCGREQARCLFHKMKIHLLWKGTGKMPVPQKDNSSFVERASCPFLRIVQYVRFNKYG